jgi:D-xylose transport system permease protein
LTTEAETVTTEAEIAERIKPGVMLRRLARGELGSIRVILGIAVIWTIFQLANDRFLSAVNLSNLSLQIAAVATISIGVVLVLLLGEIDLSVGAVSGLAASVMAVMSVKEGLDPALAILLGLLVGCAIGMFNGFMVTVFGIPSFVVTLAGLLGWQGAQLAVLGDTGSVNLPDSIITDLTSTFFDPAVGWALAAAAVAAYALSLFARRSKRVSAGLEAEPVAVVVARIVLVSAAIIATVLVLNADRGVPLAALIVVVLTVLFTFLTERTRWGRHVFAVGGNEEAARRAGINVDNIKIACFAICSMMAVLGGIVLASRLRSVDTNAGGGQILLYSIAAAVIGGTSLFGGRGHIKSAVLGALVIASIDNGLGLLGLGSGEKFVITGLVLLLAVAVDSLARRRQTATGRI